MTKAFIVDEFCDLDPVKICNNCGTCLNMSKSDLQAIKIEEIAKDAEHNSIVCEDLEDSTFIESFGIQNWEELLAKAKKIDPNMDKALIEKALIEAYENSGDNFKDHLKSPAYNLANTDDVIAEDDALGNEVVYLEDINLHEDILEEDTEEIFPGVRILKKK